MATLSFPSLPSFTPRKITFPRPPSLQNQTKKNSFSQHPWSESFFPSSAISAECLEREFGGRGTAFEPLGDDCVVKMALEEGTTANMMLPRGLITSYKPMMWHGGRVEVIHTLVSEDENGEVMVQGGVSMDVKCVADTGLIEWSPVSWKLHDVRGSSDKFIQFVSKPEQLQEIRYEVNEEKTMCSLHIAY